MSDDIPADVHASLQQLLSEARKATTIGDGETAQLLLESAYTVATNKLPEGQQRVWLRHGCQAAQQSLPDEALAGAYIVAMERRFPDN